jgi:hypothetical protein
MTREQMRVGPAVRAEVRRRWPGGVIPPTEGGRFFRDMSDRLGCEEYVMSMLGQAEGWWPWTPGQVIRAFEKREREERMARREAKRGRSELENANCKMQDANSAEEKKETWLPVFGWV